MKFLEDEKLIQLTAELTDLAFGSRVLNGRVEAFSMKRAGTDKKYAHSLAVKYGNEVTVTSPAGKKNDEDYYSKSPLGDFYETGTRRLMTDLILTLNSSFPDYDFGSVHVDHFLRIKNSNQALYAINEKLSAQKSPEYLNRLWKVMDEVIILNECEVFSYMPKGGEEDFYMCLTDGGEASCSDDALWNFNYFFVNKGLKRIVFFTCLLSYLKNEEEEEDVDIEDEKGYMDVGFPMDDSEIEVDMTTSL